MEEDHSDDDDSEGGPFMVYHLPDSDDDDSEGGSHIVYHLPDWEEDESDDDCRRGFISYDYERPEIKRRKIGTISELAKKALSGKDLLETLRGVNHEYGPETNEEAQMLMDLILEHKSHFPLKLRTLIDKAKVSAEKSHADSSLTVAKYFYLYVCTVVAHWLCGFVNDEAMDGDEVVDQSWHGPDIKVDTKDQVELAIRLCPDVYREIDRLMANLDVEMFNMASCIEGVSFLPLVVGLNPQFPDGLHMPTISVDLLNGRKDAPSEFDEKGFDVFRELVDNDRVTRDDLRIVLCQFLLETIQTRSFDFIAKRIRFIIGHDPTLLTLGSDQSHVFFFFPVFCNVPQSETFRPVDTELYKLALELGLLHFPNQVLGFALHEMNLVESFEVFGEEPVKQAINDTLASTLEKQGSNKSKMLLDWTLQAATDEFIGLDGLHTLIRFDPTTVVMNERTK